MQNTPKQRLRYYKFSPHKSLFRKHSQTLPIHSSQNRLLNELQQQIAQQNECTLTPNNVCHCKVCKQVKRTERTREDYYQTHVQSYECFFMLLLHLNMIEADEATRILGDLLIPVLFFKKEKGSHSIVKFQSKKQDNKNNILDSPGDMNFIVFKTNPKTKRLQYPFMLHSLQRVSKQIKQNQQQLRKQKLQQHLTIISYHESITPEPSNLIHKKYFNQEIPPYLIPSHQHQRMHGSVDTAVGGSHSPLSKKNYKKPEVKKFIIHEEDCFIREEQQYHKVKDTQPFCIFRYTDNDRHTKQKVSKYEIFTMEGIQMYERNWRKLASVNTQQSQLQLKYIQSYTRIKTYPKQSSSSPSSPTSPNAQLTYFSQYRPHPQIHSSPTYTLTHLQIQLKSKTIPHIDPRYLSPLQLQQKIEQHLNLNSVLSTEKNQKIVEYKTYKIVNILAIVCRIVVDSLRLKWILNCDDDIVLLECLQYQVNRDKSLKPKKNQDEHVERIVTEGLELLKQGYVIEDIQQIHHSHQNIQKIVQNKLNQKRKQFPPPTIASPPNLKQISKSLQFPRSSLLKPLKPSLKNTLNLRRNTNLNTSSLVAYTDGMDPTSLIRYNKLGLISNSQIINIEDSPQAKKRMYRSSIRKSYKLRPFKTEASTSLKEQL